MRDVKLDEPFNSKNNYHVILCGIKVFIYSFNKKKKEMLTWEFMIVTSRISHSVGVILSI